MLYPPPSLSPPTTKHTILHVIHSHIHRGHVQLMLKNPLDPTVFCLINKNIIIAVQLTKSGTCPHILESLLPEVPSIPLSPTACWDIQVTELQSVAQALTKEKS